MRSKPVTRAVLPVLVSGLLIALACTAGAEGTADEEDTNLPPFAAVNAEQDLAERLNVNREQIEIVSWERIDWPSAALGCPEPGRSYAQVVTPGWKVLLEHDGSRFEYHADLPGHTVVLCEDGAPAA